MDLGLLFQSCISFCGSFFRGQTVFGDTSNDVNWQEYEVGHISSKRNVLWPYKNEEEIDTAWGFNYYHRFQKGLGFSSRLNELRAHFDRFFNKKHQVQTNVGVYHIDEEIIEDASFLILLNLLLVFIKEFLRLLLRPNSPC